jgi:hypothetical protein
MLPNFVLKAHARVLQDYNRRRADFVDGIYLQDGKRLPSINFKRKF